MKYWLIKEDKILKQVDGVYKCTTEEQKISKKDFGWYVKIRKKGKYLEILKSDKLSNDIFVGNVFSNFKKKIIDNKKIKVYRGGEASIIHSSNFNEKIDQIEYIFTKNELKCLDGKVKLKTKTVLEEELKFKQAKELYKKQQIEIEKEAIQILANAL